jgi:hypothetical protein
MLADTDIYGYDHAEPLHACTPIPVFTEGADLESVILLGSFCRECGREVFRAA